MLSQIEACSLPLLYKSSVALPAAKQTYPKKDKGRLWVKVSAPNSGQCLLSVLYLRHASELLNP